MADYYFKTVGQAWAGIMNAFTSYGQLVYSGLDFTIAWHDGATVNGGYFEIGGTALVGEAFANGKWWAAEAKSTALLPFNKILRDPGMSVMPRVTPIVVTDAITIEDFTLAIFNARYGLWDGVSDGVVQTEQMYYTPLDGEATAVIIRYIYAIVSTIDQSLDIVSCTNNNELPGTSAMTEPLDPVYVQSTQPVINNLIQTAPTLDVDATVNPGGGIYSITSRQLTTP